MALAVSRRKCRVQLYLFAMDIKHSNQGLVSKRILRQVAQIWVNKAASTIFRKILFETGPKSLLYIFLKF